MLRISVITPSFNQARYVGRTIDSVQSQRGPFELEHIVVDGGSTDGTVGILEGCGGAVRWVSEPDEGQADALNKGLAMAGGEVVGWLNSDDVYEPGALAAVAGVFAAEPDTQWLYGKVRIIDPDDREVRRSITWYKNLRMRRYSYPKLLAENWICQMGVFWRRAAGRRIGPFRKDLHYAMDYDYWLRLGALWPGRFVDAYLAAFRTYPQSKSRGDYQVALREMLAVSLSHAAGRHRLAAWRARINCAKCIAALWALQTVGRM
jgi:glycosyltransferase involved in cell wall biosynthesis